MRNGSMLYQPPVLVLIPTAKLASLPQPTQLPPSSSSSWTLSLYPSPLHSEPTLIGQTSEAVNLMVSLPCVDFIRVF